METTTLDALQTEVDFYRENQTAVDLEIRKVIADNEKLSQQVEMLMKQKLQNGTSMSNPNSDPNCPETEELRKQISTLTKERDSLHVLWQTSQKTIDALDAELKFYQSYEDNGNQNVKENIRDLQLKLETALTDYVELETKYKELNTKCSKLESELKNKEKEISDYKKINDQLEQKIKEVSESLEEYKINLAAERKSNEDLRAQLLLCQKESAGKIRRELEAKSKVAEALQLYDLVTTQKNESHKKIKELTETIAQLKKTLSTIRHDMESSYRKELDEIKDNYNEKVTDMLHHIRNLDTELVEKGMLLNKAMRDNKILQQENENYLKQQKDNLQSVDPKLALAEQRLEAMFQELVSSERRNIQLVCEKQCLAIDIQRIQDIHAREIKRRNWEENLMKTQNEEMKLQIEHLQKSLDETHNMINKLQAMLASRSELNQKMVSSKEEELIELNKHLENQMELNKKWKESYVEMTEKLKKRLVDLQEENKEIRKKLKLPSEESSDHENSNGTS
ncbi:spindle pole body component 110-like isoform X1 [Ostrinia furnacalis]|uniref:spindle pole body component 110-like isoform X1 n=2 Tax=Ostrinia furnacalis TaxID=93504 RepID=UPI00103F247D|nr:spindle pole body component 110-like isoform X1 [Ostrinia furnacalis]